MAVRRAGVLKMVSRQISMRTSAIASENVASVSAGTAQADVLADFLKNGFYVPAHRIETDNLCQ